MAEGDKSPNIKSFSLIKSNEKGIVIRIKGIFCFKWNKKLVK